MARSGGAAALLLVLAVALAVVVQSAVVRSAATDTAALLDLKVALAGTSSTSLPTWAAGTDPCSDSEPWSGVTCTGGRVTAVNLSGYSLNGSLPTSLDLFELTLLDLSANKLVGTLPANLTLPSLQALNLSSNQLIGSLPPGWADNSPQLTDLVLSGNRLAGTLPPVWVSAAGFASPFRAVLQPGNELLCGSVAPALNHTLWFDDGDQGSGAQHPIVTTLGSCSQAGNCGAAAVNKSAPNLYDLSWSNRVAALDLEALNPSVQLNGAPKQGSPVTLPCYPTNPPVFFGADAALGKATWQSSTELGKPSRLPVSRAAGAALTSADECSATAEAPAFWVVDLQRSTQVLAVLIWAGPQQMSGVEVRVADTPDPMAGAVCKSNITFDPSQGKILVCERPNKGRYVSISAQSKVSLCVVKVYPLAANAALGKTASASAGDADSTQAGQVVNGNMANTICATVVSGSNLAAWITIDLGYEAAVETVVVQNGFSVFNNSLSVRLGNTPVVNGDENEMCSQTQSLDTRVTLPIQCKSPAGQPGIGRFLTLYSKLEQSSDMYICQVLVFLAEGPAKFYLAPPAPPSPPFLPPPSPSPPSPVAPDVIDATVTTSVTALSVVLDLAGPNLELPLTEQTQQNILLAMRSTWVSENEGINGVEAVQFSMSPGGGTAGNGTGGTGPRQPTVVPQLLVSVSAGLAPKAAQFVLGTTEDGSLEAALADQGGQLVGSSTTMQAISAMGSLAPPSVPPPSPSPDTGGGGGGAVEESGGSVPVGAIVGGVMGGLALVAVAGGLLFMRRRQRQPRIGSAAGKQLPGGSSSGYDSPKVLLGAMEQGRGSPLHDFPKPGDMGNGYRLAALAAATGSGNFTEHLKMSGEPMTQGPPAEVISFLADDTASDHSAMLGLNQAHLTNSLGWDSPSGWGGSSTGGGSAVNGALPRTASEGASLAGVATSASAAASGALAQAPAPLQKQKSSLGPLRMDSGVSELWTVAFTDLAIEKQIGEGSFGKVFLAKWRETTVAVKVLGNCSAGLSSGLDDEFPDAAAAKGHPLYESLQKEAAMMASLRHPSIVMYLGVCLDPPAVVTEYCARGSLNDVLKRARSSPLLAAQLDWARRLNMALDAAKGMLYLHSCSPPIIHRDLKSANLLVDRHWRVRVCDFNLSRVMEDSAVLSSVAATNPRWLAPEILSGKGYTYASDVYSFGICMWELLTWQVPYWEYGPWQVVAMVTENSTRPEVPPVEELPAPTFNGDGEYLLLMQECWAQEPADRPTFAAVISRLRAMLALETAVRRESPTKALRAAQQSTALSLGSASASASASASMVLLSGEDTPGTRSRLASLTGGSELGVSPELRRCTSDADLLLSGSSPSGMPGMLAHSVGPAALPPLSRAELGGSTSGRSSGSSGSGSEAAQQAAQHGQQGQAQQGQQGQRQRRSTEGSGGGGLVRQLSSIVGQDREEAEAVAEAAAEAAAAATVHVSLAGGSGGPPEG